MRALTAIVTLAACAYCVRADLPRALLTSLGIKDHTPAHQILKCGQTLGVTKCISAFSVWRAQNALETLQEGKGAPYDFVEAARKFPWQQYSNSSDEQLYSELCDETEKLLRYRSLYLSIPGYSLELDSKGNGTLNVDLLKNDDVGTGRGMMKKMMKKFYGILPFLLLPGLIMSAILPFVLPALKMMTVGVGMLNNMALSGAVFTLLRNNAFSDKYEHKIIYVNEGYKNEKVSPVYQVIQDGEGSVDHFDIPLEYASSNVKSVMARPEEFVEVPSDNDFINQYYGNGGMKFKRSSSQRVVSRRKSRE